MASRTLLEKLRGGDIRSVGKSDEVASLVLEKPNLFAELVRGMYNDDPITRMRAADAAEKASAKQPRLLNPFKAKLLRLLDNAKQQELRWHLAQMVPRLPLGRKDRLRAVAALRRYLDDPSSIVRTFALQALADIAKEDKSVRPEIQALLRISVRTGTPAMKARSRRLLEHFED